ncbi:hypothetical protein BDK51DRAFT_37819 [Blyttiomyces helicus]|uniref:Uncharacterized protein n=1 Tax=Blyttiomyces helicus TaxID=388810 RepID=A0A4V1IRP4_9FUNG|nr:hypothetical protein BDK51DRAFT_37819 [Blyttiomyces helicus]|eukprot:RKO90767.1 hypothetical protein BDK51DRAFT_37819 [Blyttiomyces helicus]
MDPDDDPAAPHDAVNLHSSDPEHPRDSDLTLDEWIPDTHPQDRLAILRSLLKGDADHSIQVFVLRHVVSKLKLGALEYMVGVDFFFLFWEREEARAVWILDATRTNVRIQGPMAPMTHIRASPPHPPPQIIAIAVAMLSLNLWSSRAQLCHAFGGDAEWFCYVGSEAPSPDIEPLYRGWSTVHVLALIEGLVVYSAAGTMVFLGAALWWLDRRTRVGSSGVKPNEAAEDGSGGFKPTLGGGCGPLRRLPLKGDTYVRLSRIFLISTALASRFSLLYGLAGVSLIKSEPNPRSLRILRRFPRTFGIALPVWKRRSAAVGVAVVLIAGVCVGILSVWGKFELARVAFPRSLGVPWTFGQVFLLVGLANNVAALFELGQPSKITYLK